jgi:hypothetical protein
MSRNVRQPDVLSGIFRHFPAMSGIVRQTRAAGFFRRPATSLDADTK